MTKTPAKITLRSLVLGTAFAAVFAVLTVLLENRRDMCLTANQMPVLPYVLLLAMVVLINPLCRLARVVRQFSAAEILIVFVMGTVSSGISTFGLTSQLLPVVGSFYNQHWNNDQSEWNLYVDPYLNENLFISEPGVQAAAREYRDAVVRGADLQAVYGAALNRANAATPPPAADAEVLRAYPALIAAGKETVAAKRAVLREREASAFEKVAVFRRGLPRGLRAFPGLFPVVGEDDAASYFGRCRRLVCGKRAARSLHDALGLLRARADGAAVDGANAGKIDALLARAAERLAPAAALGPLEAKKADLERLTDEITRELVALTAEIEKLNEGRRLATVAAAGDLERQARGKSDRRKDLEDERTRLSFSRERTLGEIEAGDRVKAAVEEIGAIRASLAAPTRAEAAEVSRRIADVLGRFQAFDGTLRRYFLGDVPWGHWVGPLWRWAVLIGLTYLVLMTFNVLIFRQWAYNEKLIYPLAQLPEFLCGAHDEGPSRIPAVFRSGLFWVGVTISGSVLGWNLLCRSNALPGLKEIDLANSWTGYIINTPLWGLYPGGRSSIFFTLIGLAFLIPKKVSFSLWFFWVLYMVQLLLFVWTGHGQDERSFPHFWWCSLNFRTAEGFGALLVFASAVLVKCRKYLLCAIMPSSVQDLQEDERRELRLSSALFLVGTLGLLLMMWRVMGVHPFYAVFVYAIVMVLTIGLVRAVTEGGILGFQAWVGPFHFIRHVFGFDKAWTTPPLVAPLMVYYSVLFLDIKAFIAPAMANGLKIRDDLKMARGRFHLAVFLAIAVASVAAIAAAIMMAYSSGADAMESWFYISFPKGLYAQLSEMHKTPPTATASGRLWLGFGAAFMALLLFLRQRLFWLPHPIGAIMLVNPIMQTYWFSIFLGWIAKALVTKYGNKDTYARVRGLFVGLIVGELVVVTVAMILSLILNKNMGIDLNRN